MLPFFFSFILNITEIDSTPNCLKHWLQSHYYLLFDAETVKFCAIRHPYCFTGDYVLLQDQ